MANVIQNYKPPKVTESDMPRIAAVCCGFICAIVFPIFLAQVSPSKANSKIPMYVTYI
tara:strand:- start:753 stop:926 length:174 start_codon:yes stop_codon:yes gene_type:complete